MKARLSEAQDTRRFGHETAQDVRRYEHEATLQDDHQAFLTEIEGIQNRFTAEQANLDRELEGRAS